MRKDEVIVYMKSEVLNQSCSISKLFIRRILPDRSKDEKPVRKNHPSEFFYDSSLLDGGEQEVI